MPPLTVASLTEALENMEMRNEQLVAVEVWLMTAMEVGHELMVTIAVTCKVLVIVVVNKEHTINGKQSKNVSSASFNEINDY